MSVNFNSANRPQNNNIQIGPRQPAPQAPQGAGRAQIPDSLASPRDSGSCDICGWVTSVAALLRNLWHRFLRWIGLENAPEMPQEDPVDLYLPQREPRQEPDPFDPQLLADLALALKLQEEDQPAKAPAKAPPKPARVVPPPPPKGLYPVPSAPFKVPEEFLFSDGNKLLEATQKYFEEFHVPSAKRLNFSDIPANCTIQQLFEHLLKKHEGICIGEAHLESAPKYLLCYFMPLFVSLGVDTLYIEGYPCQTFQADFDKYFEPGTRAEDIPPGLETKMRRIEKMQGGIPGYTERDVIIAAKRAGIRRVISIDTAASQNTSPYYINGKGTEVHGVARLAAMNFQAKCIIDHTMGENGGKCLIYAGFSHTGRCAGIPSLEQLCAFPSIIARDKSAHNMVIDENAKVDPSSISSIVRQATISYEKRTIEHDFQIAMPAPLKHHP